MPSSRARQVSSFTVIKGALVAETYAAFHSWEFDRTAGENFARIRDANVLGAASANWLRDVIYVLHRRFDPGGRDRQLVELARRGCDLETWKPLLLWHMTRDEFLVRHFLLHWLYPAFVNARAGLRSEDVLPFLAELRRHGAQGGDWTETTSKRVAAGLLKIAVDVGLLEGTMSKSFRPYHLPEASFLYLLHAMAAEQPNARKIIDSQDWRMYLMRPEDVERELLRLHQYRRLEYETAGTLSQLKLPRTSTGDYVRELVP